MAEAVSLSDGSATVQPLRVAYCTVSGFPYEYCEFHSDFKKCIAAAAADPALRQYLPIIMNKRESSEFPFSRICSSPLYHFQLRFRLCCFGHSPPSHTLPLLIPSPSLLPPNSGIESLLASLSLDAPAPEAAADGGAASAGEAAAAGGSAKGGKKEKEKAVLIFESKKNKGKKATVVRGLDAFGVKLSDASKVKCSLFPRMPSRFVRLPCPPPSSSSSCLPFPSSPLTFVI
jgi:hypothetical protein